VTSTDDPKGVDVGIVIRDSEAALRFYRDTVGLEHTGDVKALTGVMHRLRYGTSVIKLTRPDDLPAAANPPGGFLAGSGIRYLTFAVPDLDAMVAKCEAAGYRTAVGRTAVRPGVTIAVVEDAEGNWVEFLESA
jgi:catechol 2,3-dioxygenase-like lactoylglutathione lyase family enzyme